MRVFSINFNVNAFLSEKECCLLNAFRDFFSKNVEYSIGYYVLVEYYNKKGFIVNRSSRLFVFNGFIEEIVELIYYINERLNLYRSELYYNSIDNFTLHFVSESEYPEFDRIISSLKHLYKYSRKK